MPKGTRVVLDVAACNRDPALWGPDAAEWRPTRWLEPLPRALEDARVPGVYSHMMTFIAGPKACMCVILCSSRSVPLTYHLHDVFTVGSSSHRLRSVRIRVAVVSIFVLTFDFPTRDRALCALAALPFRAVWETHLVELRGGAVPHSAWPVGGGRTRAASQGDSVASLSRIWSTMCVLEAYWEVDSVYIFYIIAEQAEFRSRLQRNLRVSRRFAHHRRVDK